MLVKKEFRRRGIARGLVHHLVENLPGALKKIEIINVENSDKGMIEFLKNAGFEFIIGQYEMAYDF